MQQKIIVFNSVDDAVNTLKNFASNFKFPYIKYSREKIINKSVEYNIFRAFRNLNDRPSQIYRTWASDNFDSILSDFENVNSKEGYYLFAFKYADSLIKQWALKTLKPDNYLMYGPALKMINLFIKTTQQSFDFRKDEKTKYQQVPFDSFSLIPLRSIINNLTGLEYKITIPNNATMGFINTQQIYRIIMDAVYDLCLIANISPIIYDFWCWEDKHIYNPKPNTGRYV